MKARPLTQDDVPDLLPLLDQIGYPVQETALVRRVERLLRNPDVACWGIDYPGSLVGMATGHLSWHIEMDSPAARLTAIVVDDHARGLGIARALLDTFESWAREHGAKKAVLSSGDHRNQAHSVYEHSGWRATGTRFVKDLA